MLFRKVKKKVIKGQTMATDEFANSVLVLIWPILVTKINSC